MLQILGRSRDEGTLLITDPAQFLGLFEHSPWVVERAFAAAPFADAQALHQAMLRAVDEAGEEAQLALIRAHPELAAREVPLTEASTAEQQGAGLRALTAAEFARFAVLNAAYGQKFGFPFITARTGFSPNLRGVWRMARRRSAQRRWRRLAKSPGCGCRIRWRHEPAHHPCA